MSSHEQDTTHEIAPAQTAGIWKTFIILLILTAIEFVIVSIMDNGPLRIAIFCGMTIVKAFFIMADFMHLKHETKSLVWSILLPLLFIVWLMIALIHEGGHLYNR